MSSIDIKKGEQNNYTSTIKIDYEKQIVEKIVDYDPHTKELFFREIYWLEKLAKTGIVPKLLKYNPNTYSMTMEWCGERLSNNNKPDDVYEQLFNIHMILLQHHCYYNDWKWGNFVVKNGKVVVIDFGWCPQIIEDFSCNNMVKTEFKEKPNGGYFKDIFDEKE